MDRKITVYSDCVKYQYRSVFWWMRDFWSHRIIANLITLMHILTFPMGPHACMEAGLVCNLFPPSFQAFPVSPLQFPFCTWSCTRSIHLFTEAYHNSVQKVLEAIFKENFKIKYTKNRRIILVITGRDRTKNLGMFYIFNFYFLKAPLCWKFHPQSVVLLEREEALRDKIKENWGNWFVSSERIVGAWF